MDKYGALETYFGYTAFREGQEPVIDALLSARDAVGIMPTGAGKSLCFQVPALLMRGTTLVISPLISLMKDQVNALVQAGISAGFLNSSLSAGEQSRMLDQVREGECRILYVAPERLFTPEFQGFAQQGTIGFVAVDEAHCVSQWGQDFRPGYLRIREFIEELPVRPVVGAFTATATPRVLEDIVALLGLREPEVVTTGFDRANLYYEVQSPKNKFAALEKFLGERRDKSGIIYCLTRKSVEEVCRKLQEQDWAATRYHAGLSAEERRVNQEAFQADDARVMVATNAFGMGIDKSNVAFVVHYNMPKNIESYYQEAGRAGRDGSPAECLLLYSGQDVVTNQFFIDNAEENEEMDGEALAEFKEHERERLKRMTFYCHSGDCLRAYLLGYFGEKAESYCGNCGNCLHQFDRVDITVESQKILSCVKRMGERYGIKLLVDTLRGSKSERVLQLGFDGLTTYGIMADASEKRVREIIGFLLAQGYLLQTTDEYPVLRLGEKARGVLFQGETLAMHLSREQEPSKTPRRRADASIENPELYAKLQTLRTQIAKSQSVPAYVVFPDATLREMSASMPRTEQELLAVSGVGQRKLEKYGEAFLEVIRESVVATN